MIKSAIKTDLDNIFSTYAFEDALVAAQDIRDFYIILWGTKSWNSILRYCRKVNQNSIYLSNDSQMDENAMEHQVDELKMKFNQDVDAICDSFVDDDENGKGAIKRLENLVKLQKEYLSKYGRLLGSLDWRKWLKSQAMTYGVIMIEI
ncbi:MAG: hypothetical protein HDS07_00535 [Bacteroides sp.]|nr:hypothetical protein [Bacteroides sp.]